MHLKIVTVDKTIADVEIKSIKTQSPKGEFETLENHSPLIALTVPTTTVYVTNEGVRQVLFTSTGVLKVQDNVILFITDSGELKSAIDLERARCSEELALQRIANSSRTNRKIHQEALARARARIKTKQTE